METKLWAILLMVGCTFLTSIAQIFYKIGANKLSLTTLLTNYYLLIGLGIYGFAAVLMITAFKGGDVSVLYPIIATSYIWVGFLSAHFFNENLNFLRWLGIIFIVAGIVFVSLGSKKTAKYVEVI